MPIILSSPASAPRPTVPALPPRSQTWTGIDGSVWSLVGPGVNPRLRPGVKGLHMPAMDVSKQSTPLVPGVEIMGYSIGEREVYWPLMFKAVSVDDWELQHGAFMDSFDPVEPGVWTVGEGDEARTLPLRGDFRGDYSFTRDPFITRYAIIGVQLEAARPLWRGKAVTRTFSNGSGVKFIPEEGGPPLHISPSATFANATISNLGDEPTYLTWEILGPHPAGTRVGVGGATIVLPFDLNAGELLVIDTDPAGQYSTLNGADVTRELGFQEFAPVPARGTTPLSILTPGAGKITARLVPLYRRAF